jgi:hypothetical protein
MLFNYYACCRSLIELVYEQDDRDQEQPVLRPDPDGDSERDDSNLTKAGRVTRLRTGGAPLDRTNMNRRRNPKVVRELERNKVDRTVEYAVRGRKSVVLVYGRKRREMWVKKGLEGYEDGGERDGLRKRNVLLLELILRRRWN